VAALHRIEQHAHEVVDISSWEADPDFPFGPQGAKPKRILVCPAPPPHPFLIGGHRYLFKEPTGSRAQHIWSELIAYELARDSAVDVPPAFLAEDRRHGVPGVLVEFFYGHMGESDRRFVPAIDIFQGQRAQVNLKVGSLRDNVRLSRAMQAPQSQAWWARTIAFDALIANTDRHSENWGFIVETVNGAPKYKLAPVFDNGTSLGHIVRDEDLPKFHGARLTTFCRQGKHHYGWLSGDEQTRPFATLCGHYVKVYPTLKGVVLDLINRKEQRIVEIVNRCLDVKFGVPFTQERARFVIAQVSERRSMIEAAVGAE
jgi:hypothetical protein